MGIKNQIAKSLDLKGKIVNLSDHSLWVVETDTKKDGYQAVAHILAPKSRAPYIDCDGFRRVDNQKIDGHDQWWKIESGFIVFIYNSKDQIKSVAIPYKKKVKKDEFGQNIYYDDSPDWSVPLILVSGVQRNKKKQIVAYRIEGQGWVNQAMAVNLARQNKIDNAVVVKGKNYDYLRSRPDYRTYNNFSAMG